MEVQVQSLITCNKDVLKMIFLFLEVEDMVSLSQSCSTLRIFCERKSLWKRHGFVLSQRIKQGKGLRKRCTPKEICLRYALGQKMMKEIVEKERKIYGHADREIHKYVDGCKNKCFVLDIMYGASIYSTRTFTFQHMNGKTYQKFPSFDVASFINQVNEGLLGRRMTVRCRECKGSVICQGYPSLLGKCVLARVRYIMQGSDGELKVRWWQLRSSAEEEYE